MTDKQQFISDWLKDNPNGDMSYAINAWRNYIDFVNQFRDWDDQIDWEDD